PEAVTDPDAITHVVDLYALGAVGYFLITGKRLFEGETAVDVCLQHVTQPPRPPSELARLAPELEAILLRCLAKQPADRYATAAALAEALEALPPAGDWSKADAAAWWEQFRTTQASELAVSAARTRTITVDVSARSLRVIRR